MLFDSHGRNLPSKFQSLHTVSKSEKGMHVKQRHLFL